MARAGLFSCFDLTAEQLRQQRARPGCSAPDSVYKYVIAAPGRAAPLQRIPWALEMLLELTIGAALGSACYTVGSMFHPQC